MSGEAGGETPQLPVIRKTFLLDWRSGESRVYYNITGSTINEQARFLALVNEDLEEFIIPLEHVTCIHSYHADEDG